MDAELSMPHCLEHRRSPGLSEPLPAGRDLMLGLQAWVAPSAQAKFTEAVQVVVGVAVAVDCEATSV
jgi:hypothetical protein